MIAPSLNIPAEHVLTKQFNEEQNNKNKKLLSELNMKRRSRQRKTIMVVNTGNSQRSGLLSPNVVAPQLANGMNSESINNNQQQNIIYSKPVAAVVRQIVNNVSNSDSVNSSPKSTNNFSVNSKAAVPNFHLLFNNLIESSPSNNNDALNRNNDFGKAFL